MVSILYIQYEMMHYYTVYPLARGEEVLFLCSQRFIISLRIYLLVAAVRANFGNASNNKNIQQTTSCLHTAAFKNEQSSA